MRRARSEVCSIAIGTDHHYLATALLERTSDRVCQSQIEIEFGYAARADRTWSVAIVAHVDGDGAGAGGRGEPA